MFGLGKRKHQIRTRTGLDIGTYDIKAIEITEGEGRPLVTALQRKTLLASTRDERLRGVKALMEEAKIVSREVNIAVAGPPVIVRFISMPKMSQEEMAGAIRFEAEKHIPFTINECVIDFQVLRRYDAENKSDVLLAAVKREAVEERVKLVMDAGLTVGVVDIDGFATANAYLKNYPGEGREKTVLLLDIGAGLTNLTILRSETICLLRDVAIGGGDIIAALARGFGADPNDPDGVQRIAAEKEEEALAHVRPVLTNLIDEVRLSCSYYENQCGRTVDEIYVSGGAAGMQGLPAFFQDSFGIKPERLDPFRGLDTVNFDGAQLKKLQAFFPVAVGLAFR